jgi:hypothetical protein
MTVIHRARNVRRLDESLGRPAKQPPTPETARLAARMLITVVVALAMVASGLATSPATTFMLGIAAIVWLLMSFDMEPPA